MFNLLSHFACRRKTDLAKFSFNLLAIKNPKRAATVSYRDELQPVTNYHLFSVKMFSRPHGAIFHEIPHPNNTIADCFAVCVAD